MSLLVGQCTTPSTQEKKTTHYGQPNTCYLFQGAVHIRSQMVEGRAKSDFILTKHVEKGVTKRTNIIQCHIWTAPNQLPYPLHE